MGEGDGFGELSGFRDRKRQNRAGFDLGCVGFKMPEVNQVETHRKQVNICVWHLEECSNREQIWVWISWILLSCSLVL